MEPNPNTDKIENNNRQRVRILVVDDDSIFGSSFAIVLRDKGYSVELVETGNAAIRKLENEHFDIVFLDLKLPDMDGTDVLKKIKQARPETDVIMITAYSFDGLAEELTRAGAFAYFCKPFNIDLVLRAIEELSK